MKLTADYHTHTPYSHGKNTVLENATRAAELGLKQIAITDHGFSHTYLGLKRKEVPSLVRECREASKETGVDVLVGIESNIRGISGLCDLEKADYENFDVYLAGIHIVVHYEHFSDRKLGWRGWHLRNLHLKPSQSLIRDTTRAYINAVEKNPLDAISHLNFLAFADPVEVAKCCRDYGTYIELNAKKEHLTDEQLAEVAATGVHFIVDSDAHTADRVGDCALVEGQIARVGLSLDLIDNIDGRLPNFRFAEFKKHM